jgi:SAM-dependent methyltransferase
VRQTGSGLKVEDGLNLIAMSKGIVWKAVNFLPVSLRYRAFEHRARANRRIAGSEKTVGSRPSFEHYWSRYRDENRVAFVEYITRAFDNPAGDISVLDFGCHCGNMLRLMNEELKGRLNYLGVDPSEENLAFAREQFLESPHPCEFVPGTDETILKLVANRRFDIFLISSVCYALSPRQLDRVLEAASQCANHILIADDLSRLEARSCTLGSSWLHPYRRQLLRHSRLTMQSNLETQRLLTRDSYAPDGWALRKSSESVNHDRASAPASLLQPFIR